MDAAKRLEQRAGRGLFGPIRKRLVRRLVSTYRAYIQTREYPKQGLAHVFTAWHEALCDAGELLVTEGISNSWEDVWFLRKDELFAALDGDSIDVDIVARRAEFERHATKDAPPVLTSEGEASNADIEREDVPDDALVGTGVSGGIVEGPARVVRNPAEETIESGEILIASSSDPGWTPPFLNAEAIVVEVGGRLSHGALVAREYGLPGVVSVAEATQRIETGDHVRVDGDRGTVELLDQSEQSAGVDDLEGSEGEKPEGECVCESTVGWPRNERAGNGQSSEARPPTLRAGNEATREPAPRNEQDSGADSRETPDPPDGALTLSIRGTVPSGYVSMNYSRRSVLASTVALSLALAGCDSQGSPSDGSSSDGSSSDGGSSDGSGTNETTATSTETRTFASPLARDTAFVFDEVAWFANHYNTTLYQYRGHVEDIEQLVANVRSKSAISESDVANISSRTSTFHEFVRDEMAPHFEKTSDIRNTTNHYIAQVDKFRRRGDDAELDAQLASFRRYYRGLGLDSFHQERFSGRPIRRPLYDYLRSPGLGNTNPVFVVGHPARPFLRPCHLSSSWDFDLRAATEMHTDEMRTYFEVLELLFDGVHVPADRSDRIYVESYTKNGPRRSRPIYVQRYSDAGAAEEALGTITDRTTDEGTTNEFGRPTWHRLFYRRPIRMKFLDDGYAVYDVNGDIVYGPDGAIIPETSRLNVFDRPRIQREEEPDRTVYVYVARTGRHVIAASPSTLAWEERPSDAEDAIKNSWLWGSADGDDGS